MFPIAISYPSYSTMADVSSLDDAENQPCFCLRNSAALIYWSHTVNRFDFFLPSDRHLFRGEMRNLRNGYRDGRATSLLAGEPLQIDGTTLYPIEVMYRQSIQCPAYFLLRWRRDMSDLEKTPYFSSVIRNAMKPLVGLQEDVTFEGVLFVQETRHGTQMRPLA